jgi:hypothetical protein
VVDETPRPTDHDGENEENLAATRPYERINRFPKDPVDRMATTDRIEPLDNTRGGAVNYASTKVPSNSEGSTGSANGDASTDANASVGRDGSGSESVKPRRPRRKRGRVILISLLVLIVLLVVAYFVGERVARDYAVGYIREQVVTGLDLPSDEGVGVDLGEGSFLLQAATGAITKLDITVDEFTLGDVSGSATATAHHVPLDSTAPVSELAIAVEINEDQLTALSDSLSGSNLDSVELDGQNIRIGASVKILAVNIPISVALLPGAENGEIVFTPVDITAAGQQLTADALRDGLFGDIAAPLLTSRAVCIASELPAALTLDDVTVVGNNLVATLNGDGAVLGEDLATKGTCD